MGEAYVEKTTESTTVQPPAPDAREEREVPKAVEVEKTETTKVETE